MLSVYFRLRSIYAHSSVTSVARILTPVTLPKVHELTGLQLGIHTPSQCELTQLYFCTRTHTHAHAHMSILTIQNLICTQLKTSHNKDSFEAEGTNRTEVLCLRIRVSQPKNHDLSPIYVTAAMV